MADLKEAVITPLDVCALRALITEASVPDRSVPACSIEGCPNGADPRFGIRAGHTWAPACDAHGGSIHAPLRDPLPSWPRSRLTCERVALEVLPAVLDRVEQLETALTQALDIAYFEATNSPGDCAHLPQIVALKGLLRK